MTSYTTILSTPNDVVHLVPLFRRLDTLYTSLLTLGPNRTTVPIAWDLVALVLVPSAAREVRTLERLHRLAQAVRRVDLRLQAQTRADATAQDATDFLDYLSWAYREDFARVIEAREQCGVIDGDVGTYIDLINLIERAFEIYRDVAFVTDV